MLSNLIIVVLIALPVCICMTAIFIQRQYKSWPRMVFISIAVFITLLILRAIDTAHDPGGKKAQIHAERVRKVLNGGEVPFDMNQPFPTSVDIAERVGLITKDEADRAHRYRIIKLIRLEKAFQTIPADQVPRHP